MEVLGKYLLQIVAAAILCGILSSLCERSAYMPVMRMILGVVMLICVLQPILKLRFRDISMQFNEIAVASDGFVAEGQEMASAAASAIISDSVNTYIENKAAALGAEVTASVYVKEGIPGSVIIIGDVSPYVRSQLSAWIVAEIGIGKEEQKWN